jgi:hypothetical protein
MADQDEDQKKPGKQSGSGRPGTKFMERPKPGQQKDPSPSNIPPADIGEEDVSEEEDVMGGGPVQRQQQGQQQRQPQQQGQQQQQKKGQQGKQGQGSN